MVGGGCPLTMSVPPVTPLDDERPPSLAGHMWRRFAIACVLILLLSGAATATFALTKLNHIANEVFPDPETPTTTTVRHKGTSTSMFRRLLWRAPRTVMCVMDI